MNAHALANILRKLEAAANIVAFEGLAHAGDWTDTCIRQWEAVIRA